MNRKRPHIIFVFPAIMLLLCNSCQRYNDEKDFTVRFMHNTTVTITGYTGTSKDVRIPPRIGGLPVTVIGENAFSNDPYVRKGNRNQITSVTIPNTVTVIEKKAFDQNRLSSVTIPKGVTVIGYEAFAFNDLTSVIIPDGVTHIGGRAFLCNELTHVTIPNSVIEIGHGAFADNNLTSINIPDSITSISDALFVTNKLTSITIPENIVSIGAEAFMDNKLTEVIIPKNVTSIGYVAFANNNLTRITIGENVELDNRAFTGFYYFYNYAVDKRGGTYIFNNYHWSPEDKTVPILIFTSDMAENDITGKFSDIAFLTDMPDLEEVSLRDNNLLTDISPLSGLTKLKNLHLRHNNNYDYSALVPLRQLERLVIYYYGDEEGEIDLSHIGQLHSLKGLSITGNIKIINIDALQNLVNLENLEILIGISDISWVSGLRNLTDLVLITSWSIDDISLLATLPNLVNVDLTYTDRIEDITPLLNSNSIKYIRVWAHQVEAGISDNLRSRFKQKNVYLDTFYDYR